MILTKIRFWSRVGEDRNTLDRRLPKRGNRRLPSRGRHLNSQNRNIVSAPRREKPRIMMRCPTWVERPALLLEFVAEDEVPCRALI